MFVLALNKRSVLDELSHYLVRVKMRCSWDLEIREEVRMTFEWDRLGEGDIDDITRQHNIIEVAFYVTMRSDRGNTKKEWLSGMRALRDSVIEK